MNQRDLRHLGRFIRLRRQAKDLSLRGLAAIIPSVSTATIHRIEHGRPAFFAHVNDVLLALGYRLTVTPREQAQVERAGR